LQNCLVCAKKNLWQSSQYWTGEQRWWQCRNCGNWQIESPPQGLRIPPKILYLDIETALMKVYIYELYVPSKRISKDMIAQSSFVICWSASWLNSDYTPRKIVSGVLKPDEAKRQDDKRIVNDVWSLLDEADIVAGHNSDGFDLKILGWRFLLHGLTFPEYRKLDTFKLAGKYTRPPSRGLEYLSTSLGGKRKNGLDREEWIDIVETGNEKLLRKADRYCRGDVREGAGVLRQYAASIEANGRQLVR
jgi:hypothetical protein